MNIVSTVRQRITTLLPNYTPEGLFAVWVEPDVFGDINAPSHMTGYDFQVHAKQTESPVEISEVDHIDHPTLFNKMFEKVLKDYNKAEFLIREEDDPGLCYLDMTQDMGYIFICFECAECQFICNTTGSAVVNSETDETINGECRFVRVALDSNDFCVDITINDLEGNQKYQRQFKPEEA